MSKAKQGRAEEKPARKRRRFTEEFKAEAVQMLLDGHAAVSICERLGLSSPNLLYRWKRRRSAGEAAAIGLEGRVRELEAELRRVERERGRIKKGESKRDGSQIGPRIRLPSPLLKPRNQSPRFTDKTVTGRNATQLASKRAASKCVPISGLTREGSGRRLCVIKRKRID